MYSCLPDLSQSVHWASSRFCSPLLWIPQEHTTQLLPAIVLLCQGSPLETLEIDGLERSLDERLRWAKRCMKLYLQAIYADACPGSSNAEPGYDAVSVSHHPAMPSAAMMPSVRRSWARLQLCSSFPL